MLATQCSSWSRARHGPIGSSWGPIRSKQHILGLPNLLPRDLVKVKLGNLQMYKTADIIRCCIKFGVPCMLENPINSMLFQAFPIAKLLKHKSCSSVTFDQCQFGTRWRKRTRLAMWNCSDCSSLDRRCSGSAISCSASGKLHILLQGSNPDGILWTKIAQEYPAKLNYCVAHTLTESYENRLVRNTARVCGLGQ